VNDRVDTDGMDEMLEGIQPEFNLDTKEFFRLLEALKEPLHEHTKVILLAFVT
jgi:hypothetical protein